MSLFYLNLHGDDIGAIIVSFGEKFIGCFSISLPGDFHAYKDQQDDRDCRFLL
ncbi:hypothetical protein GGE16_005366 [Rhizobium leguminosarum]|uniref:Uncharacterized protein n=1 Tax=Rhizobium leguminosarum TaxID=384 RepID=A0AAE2T079_RHILE|nr:hypothetical protein [Rhizobium leguminosarum]MBB4435504.1 hypothetical protein [Rhizobium esperanzae]MBB4296112.1 hypothetical protein [Rhizobium leguminosarum]MBB4311459.1 hypothetical protein [Rhizobium leguminosarum]MBB4420341.1 hypothetical protein [Rhizobium leguminosarum]